MHTRRKFLQQSALGTLGLAVGGTVQNCSTSNAEDTSQSTKGMDIPVVLATWENEKAVSRAWAAIKEGKAAVDAVEWGVKVVEADPENMTVGYGGRPDRDGIVSLDACIMDSNGNAGSVCFLQHIKHPVSVARRVMDKSPHVILAGEGALQFALAQGFKKRI